VEVKTPQLVIIYDNADVKEDLGVNLYCAFGLFLWFCSNFKWSLNKANVLLRLSDTIITTVGRAVFQSSQCTKNINHWYRWV